MDIFRNIKKDDCCGCGSCSQSCSKNAIKMTDEGYGFKFPHIDNTKCIDCKLCLKSCPLHNIKKRSIVKCYSGISYNDSFRIKSSSGGIFYELSKYVFSKNGIVFGAYFDDNFNVKMKYISSIIEIDQLMRSKYVQADTLNTFSECEKFLEDGVFVMYVGTPCQINGLKSFLKKDYNNLLTIDIACHGVPSQLVWSNYLKRLKRKGTIDSINFRDKKNGWRDYNFTVKYKNGNEISESHKINEYMKLFLSDKILRKSCYNCHFKNDFSQSDITLSDFWGNEGIEDDKGLSGIVIQTQKGYDVITSIKTIKINETEYKNFCKKNGGFKNDIKLPKDRLTILKKEKNNNKNIGIISLPMNANIGGELQNYAMQQIVKSLGYNPITIERNKPMHLQFVDKYIKRKIIKQSFSEVKKDEFGYFIVGSDQIWRYKYCNVPSFNFLDFTKDWDVVRFSYGASFGVDTWDYDKKDTDKIKSLISKFDAISVREDNAVELCKKHLNVDSVLVLDPTMLLSKEHYINIINENQLKNKDGGVFSYILDADSEKTKLINKVSEIFKYNKITFNAKSVPDFLNAFNSCNCVVTDSFHGCVFSIIFNKPFVCILNEKRGLARFSSLINIFNLKERFFSNINDVNIEMLKSPLNIKEQYVKYKEISLNFLKNILL